MTELTKQNDPMNFTIKSKLVNLEKKYKFIYFFHKSKGKKEESTLSKQEN